MAFAALSLPSIDPDTAAALHIFLPLPVGFLASRLGYGWIKETGLQSAGFSPTLASLLTAPLLAIVYYPLALTGFGHAQIRDVVSALVFVDLVLFAPTVVTVTTLLAIYLGGGLRTKRAGIVVCVAAVVVVTWNFAGVFFFVRGLG
jgi:hypothetical protein